MMKQRRVFFANHKTHCEPELKKTTSWTTAKPKTKHQAPTHLWKLYEEVIESEARTTVVQLKSRA